MRTASCMNKSDDYTSSREGFRHPRPRSASKPRPQSAAIRQCGTPQAWNSENTQPQNIQTPGANAGKLQAVDDQNVMDGRASSNRLGSQPREGRKGIFACKERGLRSQSMGGRPQALGRKAHLQQENQNRAKFFYGTPVERIQYPDIDITTY